jgi:hypothetical protein
LQRNPVHGLKLGFRVHQQYIYPSPLKEALGTGGKLGGAPDLSFDAARALDDQIHVAATGGIVKARAKQADLAVIPQLADELLLQGQTL